jgi:hypothetical protein
VYTPYIDLPKASAVGFANVGSRARTWRRCPFLAVLLGCGLYLRRVDQFAFLDIDRQSPQRPVQDARGLGAQLAREPHILVRRQNRVVPRNLLHPAPDAEVLTFDARLLVRLEPEFELRQERDGLGADIACRDRRLGGNALDDAFIETMAVASLR